MEINKSFFNNINFYKKPKKIVDKYYDTLLNLIQILKKYYMDFNLLTFIYNYDEIIYYLNKIFTNKKILILNINAIIYVLNYFIVNDNYISKENLDIYIKKYNDVIISLKNNK